MSCLEAFSHFYFFYLRKPWVENACGWWDSDLTNKEIKMLACRLLTRVLHGLKALHIIPRESSDEPNELLFQIFGETNKNN